jgi:hypothetical protein
MEFLKKLEIFFSYFKYFVVYGFSTHLYIVTALIIKKGVKKA